ncbi:hypothetical protein HPB47_004680, partial [Ixodes persulcatus]
VSIKDLMSVKEVSAEEVAKWANASHLENLRWEPPGFDPHCPAAVSQPGRADYRPGCDTGSLAGVAYYRQRRRHVGVSGQHVPCRHPARREVLSHVEPWNTRLALVLALWISVLSHVFAEVYSSHLGDLPHFMGIVYEDMEDWIEHYD